MNILKMSLEAFHLFVLVKSRLDCVIDWHANFYFFNLSITCISVYINFFNGTDQLEMSIMLCNLVLGLHMGRPGYFC